MNDETLSGRVAFITGSAQGIGFELASKLYQAGASVWIADVNEEGAEQAKLSIGGGNLERVGASFLDVCSKESVQNAVKSCVDTLGSVDILVNNAGIVSRGKVETMDVNAWHKVMDVNLTGSFLCSQAVIPYMKKAGQGVIINVSSVSAHVPSFGLSAYCCSKVGIEMLTKILAAEVAPFGIRVNAYAPGVVRTSMTQDILEQRREEKLREMALHRFGEVEDIAALVLFLCSEKSSFMTGSIVHIDGGTMIVSRPWNAWEE